MAVTTITPQAEMEIIEMARSEQFSPDAIAAEVGCSLSAVRRVLLKAGIELHRASKVDALGPEIVGDIVSRYNAGEKVKSIISQHGIDYNTLYAALAQAQVDVRVRADYLEGAMEQRKRQAVAMYEAGEPLWRIKSETGFHQPTLHGILHELGITLRRDRARERRANENHAESEWRDGDARLRRAGDGSSGLVEESVPR